MKMQRLFIGLILVIALVISIPPGETSNKSTNETQLTSAKQHEQHEPIYINGNAHFALTAQIEGWQGDGSEENPYIIENYDINASEAIDEVEAGIEIRNTDVYFIIRNCTIHDGIAETKKGVYFNNVQNGKIENVITHDNLDGIYFEYSSNNTIRASTIYNNTPGEISRSGIWLIDSSTNNQILDCRIYNNSIFGIALVKSPNNIIKYCNFTNNGIIISGTLVESIQVIENNLVNNKPLYYFLSQHGVIFENINVGQPILVNFTNSVIKNLNISHTDVGIELLHSSNNTILDSQIHSNSD